MALTHISPSKRGARFVILAVAAVVSIGGPLGGFFPAGASAPAPSAAPGPTPTSLSGMQHYSYIQDFTGLAGKTHIDENWYHNISDRDGWSVSADSTYSAAPPSLIHEGRNSTRVGWNVVLSGPIQFAQLTVTYMCEANGVLSASVSPTGFTAAQSPIFSTGNRPAGTAIFNLTGPLLNSTVSYIAFTASSTSATVADVCAVDDFIVRLDYLQNPAPAFRFLDGGASSLAYNYGPGWTTGGYGTDTPPNLEQDGFISSNVYLNWAFATSIVQANLSLNYQCQAYADISGFFSRDGVHEWPLFTSPRGVAYSSLSVNVSIPLGGSRAAYFRFHSNVGYTISAVGNCGVDNIDFQAVLMRSSIVVDIARPVTDGSWTPNTTTDGSGTASGPNRDVRILNETTDFTNGATLTDVSTDEDRVSLVTPADALEYGQNFSGLAGSSHVDDYWNPSVNEESWEVNGSTALLPNPPALTQPGGSFVRGLTWRALVPGPIRSAYLEFRYACEANGTLLAAVWATGFSRDLTASLLSSTGASETVFSADITPQLLGSTTAFVLFVSGGSGSPEASCAVDDVLVQLNYTKVDAGAYVYKDNMEYGVNDLWQRSTWGITNTQSDSSNDFMMIHSGVPDPSNLTWSLAGPTPIFSAVVNFTYKCKDQGSLYAWVSPDGVGETQIFSTSADGTTRRGAIGYDATAVAAGSTAFYLRFSSNGTNQFISSICAVDNVNVTLILDVPAPADVTFTGSYTSGSIDLGTAADLLAAAYGASVPPNSTAVVWLRTSADGAAWSAWLQVNVSGLNLSGATGRYVQFQGNFTSHGGVAIPRVLWMRVTFSSLVAVEYSFDLVSWTTATGIAAWSFAGASVPAGPSTLFVRARDTAGMTGYDEVDFLRDGFPPDPPSQPDAVNLSNGSAIRWTWYPSTDVGLGVSHYLLDLGSLPSNSDFISGLRVNGTSVTLQGFADGIFYARVRAVDGAGLVSAFSSASNGTRVDKTPPGAVVPIGPGPYTRGATIRWTWADSVETGSGMLHYVVAVGTTPGGNNIVNFTTPAPTYELVGLADGVSYYLTVYAVDRAQNAGQATTSEATAVDRSPPGTAANVTGPPAHTNDMDLTWRWTAASDATSGVDHYEVTVGTYPGGNDVRSANTAQLEFTFSNAPSSETYYFSVRAVDRMGFFGSWANASNVTVDRDPPTAPADVTGPAPLVNRTILSWGWGIAQDIISSSFLYEYDVGTSEGANDVATGQVTAFNVTVANFSSGTFYYFGVRARDVAGNWGPWATWPGVLVDAVGPTSPVFLPTPARTANSSQVVQWDPSYDLPASANAGVDGYLVSVWDGLIGKDYATKNLSWVVDVKEGRTFTVQVAAVDRLGNIGPEVTVSFTFDRTGPLVPEGIRLLLIDNATPTFEARWNASQDPAGVKGYWVSVGTSFVAADVADRVWVTGLVFPWNGLFNTTYYVKISAVDNLGNEGAAGNSNGGISAAPPKAPEQPTPAPQPKGFLSGPEVVASVAALAMASCVVLLRRSRNTKRR